MLDNLKIFINAADQQSLTNAAQALGMTVATVSRRVNELEKALGSELFHRSSRGLTLTPAGLLYYRECAEFITALDRRLDHLDQAINSPSGELKVMAPTNLGSGPLDVFWQGFVANHPDIALKIKLGDPAEDVISNQSDIALRSGPQMNSSLIQKLIGTIPLVLVAAEKVTGKLPSTIDTLDVFPSIAAEMFSDWVLQCGGQSIEIPREHRHISNDMQITLNLVKAGAGIALLPMSMVHESLNDGELIQVLPQWQGPHRDIYLVWPYQRTLSVRARLFRDELIDFLHKQPWFYVAGESQ
ncbi:LysR family transcriptional regulator [Microbulbifer halophilus]|uniref:LysR family transcriptional regulator n=2 Tax=Microbulbifer halophilus TaxID=453963 RepID=A0ABW5EI80_9GAMM|nr:LysR family transcriptional regulator [Microbulbifer halophilus]